MINRLKSLLVFTIAFCMLFTISIPPVMAATSVEKVTIEDINEAIEQTLNHYRSRVEISNDWEAFAINAVGEDVQKFGTRGQSYLSLLEAKIKADGVGGSMTDYERVTLGILSAGGDPTNFAGVNLIDKIVNWPDLSQGINAAVYGLIALDASNAIVPDNAKHTRNSLIDYILHDKSGAGWCWGGDEPDPDMTGMALYALAPYKDRQDVKESGTEAIKWLSDNQLSTGGYNSWGTINSESCAQVICGLTAWEIDPQGPQFTKEEGNVVTALLDFQVKEGKEKGAFKHIYEAGADPGMATQQALYGLASMKEYLEKGKSNIFYKITYNTSGPAVITALEIYPKRLEMEEGKTFTLGVRNQENLFINNNKVDWTVSNPEVATINEKGTMKTLKPGRTNIIAKLKENNAVYDAIELNVVGKDFTIEKQEDVQGELNKKIKFVVTNNSNEAKTAVCIIGLYEKDTNKLIQMNYISKSFQPNQSHTINAGFDISEEDNYEIQAMVWNDWNKGRPLEEILVK